MPVNTHACFFFAKCSGVSCSLCLVGPTSKRFRSNILKSDMSLWNLRLSKEAATRQNKTNQKNKPVFRISLFVLLIQKSVRRQQHELLILLRGLRGISYIFPVDTFSSCYIRLTKCFYFFFEVFLAASDSAAASLAPKSPNPSCSASNCDGVCWVCMNSGEGRGEGGEADMRCGAFQRK